MSAAVVLLPFCAAAATGQTHGRPPAAPAQQQGRPAITARPPRLTAGPHLPSNFAGATCTFVSRDAGITWEDVADYVGALGQYIACLACMLQDCASPLSRHRWNCGKGDWRLRLVVMCCLYNAASSSPGPFPFPVSLFAFTPTGTASLAVPRCYLWHLILFIFVSLSSFAPTGIYEFGNHGGLVVMAPHKAEGPTGALLVSPE